MQQIYNDLINYLDFLKTKLRYVITFSIKEKDILVFCPELYTTGLHLHTYCNFVKSNPKTKGICISKKYKIFMKKEHGFFYGCCWAGVEEYIIPIKYSGKILLYIHISAFRDSLPASREKLAHIIDKYDLDPNYIEQLYNKNLTANPPSPKEVEGFVKPFEYMLTNLWVKIQEAQKNAQKNNPLVYKIIAYIYENISNSFTLEDMSRELKYSTSHIRHTFYESQKKSILDYVTNLRIEKSKDQLRTTSCTVAEIAYRTGFNDSNYFSGVFKKYTGMSPLQYRKNNSYTSRK